MHVNLPLRSLAVLGLALIAGPASAQQAPRPAVVVAPAEVQDLRYGATYTGRVIAEQKVDLRARVSGFLDAINYSQGQSVAAGDVLFSIQDESYQASVRQAEGALKAAAAQRDLAALERDRKKQLVERDTGTQRDLDIAEANLQEAEGQLQQLQAALDNERLQLSYTSVTAPFDGIAGLNAFDVGALIGPDSGALVTLVRLDTVDVETQIESARVLDFRAAQESGKVSTLPSVRLTLANGTAYPLAGQLTYISTEVGQGTDTVTVRARFDNPDHLLLDGALVRVSLEQGDPDLVLTVPQGAVQRDQLGSFVMVVGADSKVEKRSVTVARTARGKAVIESGLAEGELVITGGLNKVRPGVVVDAAKAG